MTNKIIFNGKEYNRIEDMPPDARQAYESAMGQFSEMFTDSDHDGVPDLFENLTTGNSPNVQVFSTSSIIFDGKAYNSPEEMPTEARQRYEQAFQDKNRDGVPDVFENLEQLRTSISGKTPRTPLPTKAMHTEESSTPGRWMILTGCALILLLIIAGWVVFRLL
ncbi:MAG: hypothetical protein Fur0022_48910 [Anaerolineales bacterium]